ncbi:hypothetical protein Ancab_039376 [Ancistrocladus abbreviatus]
MYVTKPLSLYKNSTDSVSLPPPAGPNSGYLVLEDEEATKPRCFGVCEDNEISYMPFPQNKPLNLNCSSDAHKDVFLIPVVNQPLSSNQYYAIKARGRHKGEALSCSKRKEDKVSCCFGCNWVKDAKSRPLNPDDIYQQFEFSASTTTTCTGSSAFVVKSVAPDGHPPSILRRGGLTICTSTSRNFASGVGEAAGIDSALRAQLPYFDFLMSHESPEFTAVGQWYCPFLFVKDGSLRDQIKKSIYYRMTLEQRWERIFAVVNNNDQGNTVVVDVVVPVEVVNVGETVSVAEERSEVNGVVWFKNIDRKGGVSSIGLSSLIVDRITWEQERAGWVKGKEKHERVVRTEEYGGIGWWRKFGLYMLVERFVLKRMDGSLVFTYEFKHTHQIRSKWE